MWACSTFSRAFLVIVNILFLLFGLGLFAFGMFVRFGDSFLNSEVNLVKTTLETAVNVTGLGIVDYSGFSLADALFGLAMGLIFFGLFLLIMTVLGGCGSWFKIKYMLIGYVVVCIVILVGQIIIIGILYGSPGTFHDPAKDKLRASIKSDYMGLNGTNVISISWNIIMQQFQCCGVDSYADFTGATSWTINYSGYPLLTPLACCIYLPRSADFTCASTPTVFNNYLNTGCYDEIWDFTLGDAGIVGGLLGTMMVFQILLIASGIVLLAGMKHNKTNPENPALYAAGGDRMKHNKKSPDMPPIESPEGVVIKYSKMSPELPPLDAPEGGGMKYNVTSSKLPPLDVSGGVGMKDNETIPKLPPLDVSGGVGMKDTETIPKLPPIDVPGGLDMKDNETSPKLPPIDVPGGLDMKDNKTSPKLPPIDAPGGLEKKDNETIPKLPALHAPGGYDHPPPKAPAIRNLKF